MSAAKPKTMETTESAELAESMESVDPGSIESGIGFEASDMGELPPVEDVETEKMIRDAQHSVDYANIRKDVSDADKQAKGEPTEETEFPYELVISISETVAGGIQCPHFTYKESEAKITATTISIWMPFLNKRWYYLITSALILVNKMIKCSQSVRKFLFRHQNVEASSDAGKVGA